jgi:hypothetical protein
VTRVASKSSLSGQGSPGCWRVTRSENKACIFGAFVLNDDCYPVAVLLPCQQGRGPCTLVHFTTLYSVQEPRIHD